MNIWIRKFLYGTGFLSGVFLLLVFDEVLSGTSPSVAWWIVGFSCIVAFLIIVAALAAASSERARKHKWRYQAVVGFYPDGEAKDYVLNGSQTTCWLCAWFQAWKISWGSGHRASRDVYFVPKQFVD